MNLLSHSKVIHLESYVTSIMLSGQTLITNPIRGNKNDYGYTLAYSMYATALISAKTTSKSESASLLAHMFNML